MLKKLKQLGPGIIVAAAFIGPGTVTTATIAGASYGYTLLWAILFSIIATIILQEMTGRLGIVGRFGLGEALRRKTENSIWRPVVFFLVLSAILVGNAAYEAGNLTGAVYAFEYFSQFQLNPLLIVVALIAFLILWSGSYHIIEKFIVGMVCIMGFAFLISAILIQPELKEILKGLFFPRINSNQLFMVLGLIGTTVVPYNLFLHSSAVKEKWKSAAFLNTSRLDTILSISIGGIITMAILITSAVAFEGENRRIENFSELTSQLEPLLGSWSSTVIGFGFLAAGLSSSITAPLAAAYTTSELFNWKEQLKGRKFRMIWITVLGLGILFSSLGIRPTNVILFAQVANGILLPVIAIFLVWIMNDSKLLGTYKNSTIGNFLGFLVIFITLLLSGRTILSVFGLI